MSNTYGSTTSFGPTPTGGGGTPTPINSPVLDNMSYDPATHTIITDATLRAGLNSFQLGEMHSMHSGGENVFWDNSVSGVNWFPVWQGVGAYQGDGIPMTVNPSARQYTTPFTLETNGSSPNTNSVVYEDEIVLTNNESVFSIEVYAGEDYTGEITYTLRDDSQAGRIKFSQTYDVDVTNGELMTLNFNHPSESRSGSTIAVDIRKEDDSPFLVRAGDDNTKPYIGLKMMNFRDVELTSGINYITEDTTVLYNSHYMVDISSDITLTVDDSTGLESFVVIDAQETFSPSTACLVDFGGTQGIATLNSKNDSYMFYKRPDGTWMYLDLNSNDGGIV